MTAHVEKVSADLTSIKNSSMNPTSAGSQSANISKMLAGIYNYTDALNATSTVSLGKGSGSKGKQHCKRTASETQTHSQCSAKKKYIYHGISLK